MITNYIKYLLNNNIEEYVWDVKWWRANGTRIRGGIYKSVLMEIYSPKKWGV